MREKSLSNASPEASLPPFERHAALSILLEFLALISLPYLLAPLILPAGSVWGGLLGSADDQNVHLMWARQAQDGHFFFRDLFTTESLISGDKPLFWNVLPALMGVLTRIFGVDVAFPYHFLRVALAAWGLWQFHQLVLTFTNHEAKWSRARIIALFLLAFTTGSGFLASLPGFSRFIFIDRADGNFPLMPEAFFALSAFAYPLNVASFGLLALVFRKTIEKQGAAVAFFAALLLGNIHTYDALPLLLTLGIWTLWQRKTGLKVVLAAMAGAILPVIYQFLVFSGSEEFRLKALTPTAAPEIVSLLVSLAPLLVLAALGWKKWRDFPAAPLLLIWILATFVLIYTPVSFARKMLEGVQIPLVVLAAIGLSEILSRIPSAGARKIGAALVLGVLALSPTQYLNWIWNNTLQNNSARWGVLMPPLALSRGDAAALQFLNQQKEKGAVLCLPYLGSYVPRASGKWTYAGHWAETLHFKKEKFPNVARFYRGEMSDAEAREFLKINRIRWIVEGQFEREFRGGAPSELNLLWRDVFRSPSDENGVTVVYEVTTENGP
ncbi:MAG TPA: hypothetical protein VGB45_00645 [Abditibacterium sp.]|jgi:hypothetical protein